ncbi:MAG TPA: DUF4184 family protein [Steroidobacteraceae bacterium]|jgi:hypothetical protein|nr:DUF4184 family protein [Steroidobacteraceae bacterium]
MPFTLAHPAAVLPLRHLRYLRTAPLVIGAVTPDLPYYVPARLSGHLTHDSHSAAGSLLIDLPLGLVVLGCAFLLRRPLTVLLPGRARWLCLNALEPFRRSALAWAFAPLAVLAGIWSHLLWDSFTHTDGWMVKRMALLRSTVSIGWYSGEVCHLLQYLSSAAGLAILALWYARLRAPAPELRRGRGTHPGPALLLVAGAALLIGGVQATLYYEQAEAIYHTLYLLLTRSLAWFAALYLFAGTIVTLDHRADAGQR